MLVQAPAGSGKTDLLTRRFLRLLSKVDDPAQVVAITFTKAAAAEMRHRILAELEKAAAGDASPPAADEFSMVALASRALDRSRRLGWKLLDLPAQLRISTIDSFCRDLALQQPLLSGLGGGIAIAEQPDNLYRRAARQTLEEVGQGGAALTEAIELLLLWRDNDWQEVETLLVEMLAKRDRWMHDFVLDRDPDWEELRERLERPFGAAVRESLTALDWHLDQVSGAREEALTLARFACEQSGGLFHGELAELAEFPCGPSATTEELDDAVQAHVCLANLLLTAEGSFRKKVDKNLGFPADRKSEKGQILGLIARLDAVPGLEASLAAIRELPPARYAEDDWRIVRACVTLLRHAAGQLKVVFAEAAAVDFVEVSQIAQNVLRGPDGLPTDAALAVADGIRHLLVDEFQDTSRRQHQLLASLVAAWPDPYPAPGGRTCFLVGDPMQSIYFFRDADAELFERVKTLGLEIPDAPPLLFDFVPLSSNFRTTPVLVEKINNVFSEVFSVNECNKVTFSPSVPARPANREAINADLQTAEINFKLQLSFMPQSQANRTTIHDESEERGAARRAHTQQVVDLIQSHLPAMERARIHAKSGQGGGRYRIAVLGRTRGALTPIAQALREAGIPFRALDLEKLSARPEVLDALALGRALLNPQDRVAWLGVLRAPWCGLSLEDLHRLTSADDPALLARPVPELLSERLATLSDYGRKAATRVLEVLSSVAGSHATQMGTSLGTWLQLVWLRLGGDACVDPTARANVDRLWSCLDSLPGGELDLLGPGLEAALEKLTALPDPEAGSDYGVQLMTIHKAKGLEFEVVIVPDLQARSRSGSRKLLAWLERGLTGEPDGRDESGAVTEFLVAPLQSKGTDRGSAKAWVDRIYRDRESQEVRRILYVAATRAREELHLFASPAYKVESGGNLSVAGPTNSLLATAWPALGEEIHAQFADWVSARKTEDEAGIESIAASGGGNLLVMPLAASQPAPTVLRRLPPDYELDAPPLSGPLAEWAGDDKTRSSNPISGAETRLYSRHEGGLISRALGTAVHSYLEELSRLRSELEWEAARAAVRQLDSRIAAKIRALGLDQPRAEAVAAEALELALDASRDPVGQWILSPHADAASEARWNGVVGGQLRTVQVDRVFRAGYEPLSEAANTWWIIDYKTALAGSPEDGRLEDEPTTELSRLRPFFARQLEAYAQMLRNLHGPDSILRAGLYYPRMLQLDWWEL
jgi:ATP-dependent exoDNAse (exonuclease V) beta subunit